MPLMTDTEKTINFSSLLRLLLLGQKLNCELSDRLDLSDVLSEVYK